MSLTYELRHGSYYLMDLSEPPSRLTGERRIHLMTDEVAIAFDRDEGILHKHGNPDQVEDWATNARQAYRDQGFDAQAEALLVISGAFPVAEINACLNTAGYCKVLLDKLQRGLVISAKPQATTASAPGAEGAGPVTGTMVPRKGVTDVEPTRPSPFPRRR